MYMCQATFCMRQQRRRRATWIRFHFIFFSLQFLQILNTLHPKQYSTTRVAELRPSIRRFFIDRSLYRWEWIQIKANEEKIVNRKVLSRRLRRWYHKFENVNRELRLNETMVNSTSTWDRYVPSNHASTIVISCLCMILLGNLLWVVAMTHSPSSFCTEINKLYIVKWIPLLTPIDWINYSRICFEKITDTTYM